MTIKDNESKAGGHKYSNKCSETAQFYMATKITFWTDLQDKYVITLEFIEYYTLFY